MKGFLALAAATAVAAHLCHGQLGKVDLPKPQSLHETLPTLPALKLLALSYGPLAADYYWLRALSHFGDRSMHKEGYPNLVALTQRVVGLDPYFAEAYFFAGTALTVKQLDPHYSVNLLEQGVRYRPDDWRIPLLLGFNTYYFLGDYKRGAKALARAAELPGAPPFVGPLATRVAAQAGTPEVGIALINSILPSVTDPELRAVYEKRRRLLALEIELRELNRVAKAYAQRNGRPLASLGELVADGWLKRIPQEPTGGHFFVDAQGVVHSSADAERLRMPEEKK